MAETAERVNLILKHTLCFVNINSQLEKGKAPGNWEVTHKTI